MPLLCFVIISSVNVDGLRNDKFEILLKEEINYGGYEIYIYKNFKLLNWKIKKLIISNQFDQKPRIES
jgi:hypothetical protein